MSSHKRWSSRIAMTALAIAPLATNGHAQQNDAATIRALSNQWQQYVAAQDIEHLNALFTPDAVMMLSHAPLVTGGTAVGAAWADMVKTPGLVVHWTPTRIDVASPTVATEYGTYTESYDSPQGKMTDSGNYVTIWHKINGKWRVALDAPNTTSPLPAPAAAPMDPSTMEMHSAGELAWGDLTAAGFAPGAKIAVLHGDPTGQGGFVLRLQFPDGYQIPVHWHPTGENVTVVSGSVQFGMGNTFDAAALRTYGPGDFAYLPPRQSHFGQAHGVTIVQVNGRGPFVINPGAPKY
jgi:uncharacterized protein (TIGR02246 family)